MVDVFKHRSIFSISKYKLHTLPSVPAIVLKGVRSFLLSTPLYSISQRVNIGYCILFRMNCNEDEHISAKDFTVRGNIENSSTKYATLWKKGKKNLCGKYNVNKCIHCFGRISSFQRRILNQV